MKEWIIPITYEMYGTVCVEANTLEEAMERAMDPDVPLPDYAEYVVGSEELWELDMDYLRSWYNNGQEDDLPEESEVV